MRVKVFEKGVENLPTELDILTMPELRCLIAGLGGEATISTTYIDLYGNKPYELTIIKEKNDGEEE